MSLSPVGTTERGPRILQSSLRDSTCYLCRPGPPLKRWASLSRPSGTPRHPYPVDTRKESATIASALIASRPRRSPAMRCLAVSLLLVTAGASLAQDKVQILPPEKEPRKMLHSFL